jgi:protein-disulfide isomerase-like protein with CxxC motif
VSVQVRYFSDPACTWSSAAEPALRRIIFEFDGELDLVRAMGGLARHAASPT